MRLLTLLLASSLCAQVPSRDARNTDVPHTDTHFRMPVYKTRAEWEARAAKLRKQILFAAGLEPMPERGPLAPEIFGRIENKDYSIEKVLLQTLPGYYLGGNLYRPLGKSGKFPAVLTPHGHWSYGRLENQTLCSAPARAINLARQGYVVFAYDMVGYNDTMQTPHAFGNPREQLWSFGPLGLQLRNSLRSVDFMQSLPDVDPDRIAMTGASGGGTQTFLATAVDDRIRYSAPVNMISAIMQGGSPCENAPGLRLGTSNLEIGAMMAPRPMLMIAATGDWTRNTPREEYPALRSIYELYDKASELEMIQIDAPHNYNQQSREAMYRFFGKRVLGSSDEKQFAEKNVRVEKLQDMLALWGRTPPANALTYGQLVEQWITEAGKQSAAATPAALRERLSLALASEWPARVLSERAGEKIVLSRQGRGDRVPGLWIEAGKRAALVVHPEGAEAARRSPEAREILSSGDSVLLIDAFQTGAAKAGRNHSVKHFDAFNQTDDACRAQDILTALAFLKQSGYGEIRLTGIGKAALWTLFAAAAAGTPVTLTSDLKAYSGSDADFIDNFFVPGIQRAGGMEAARRILRP
ncbi:MAG TPA: acetylxylan esterase [Bryobacteraceae bacterium]|nr:acetylxylan esterase [Bryobacteraceae bacterium]